VVPQAGQRTFERALDLTQPRLAVVEPGSVARVSSLRAETVLRIEDPSDDPLAPALREFLGEGAAPATNRAAAPELAAVMLTSGTTGQPKGVCLSHSWYVWASQDVARGMEYGPDDVLYTCLPLGHANAQDTTFGPALISGARAAFDRRFHASSFWQRIKATGASSFNLIGSMPRVLLNRPPEEYEPDHSARRAFAIPALPHYRTEFQQRFGVELRQGYGSTEIGVPVFQDDHAVARGSCGLALSGTRLRIEGDDGLPLGPGAVGEICVSSPRVGAITSGYFNDPARTEKAWRGGWFHTGDLGSLDEDGHLYFAGRLGDALRRKGENLSTNDIESVVLELAGVRDVAVVARPAADGDDDLLAFVVLEDAARITADDVADRCGDALGPAARPSHVLIVAELPKTESGKVAKGELIATVGKTR
jgi:crotonobetaine/carnitine-CoA ligase